MTPTERDRRRDEMASDGQAAMATNGQILLSADNRSMGRGPSDRRATPTAVTLLAEIDSSVSAPEPRLPRESAGDNE